MYEGIADIYQLLENGRLKEALTQLQGLGLQTNQWELNNRIENTLTAYGYMLQYAAQGVEDPTRNNFYLQTLRTAYKLTDTANIILRSAKESSVYYDLIRTFSIRPAKTYAELQMQLETFTEDVSTAPLLIHDKKLLQREMEKIHHTHESALNELFEKTWATPFWTDTEANEAEQLLQSLLVSTNDLAVMVSAATMSLLKTLDDKKIHFLFEAYQNPQPQVSQRAIVGLIIALAKYPTRINLYPDIKSRLSLLCEEESFRTNLFTIQMQLLITRETTKIDKKMREEIIPEILKNTQYLKNSKFNFEEKDDMEDQNPEWQEWMEQHHMDEKIKEMSEWQMAGADVYMSSFAQLKHYPFFHTLSHWFYPFDMNQPILAPLKKELESSAFSPLRLITASDHFCNSDKYSFCLAMKDMPKGMKEMNMQQLEEQARMSEEQLNKLEQLTHQKITAEGVSRQYIQDLYRFFKLWKRHQEEEDIFQWHFNLWEHPLLEEILQEETFMKKLADYLLQKGYLDEAYRLYNKLLQQTKTAEVYQKAGYIMQKQKQYTVAIHLYEQADLLQADNIWTVKHLAQCYKLNDNLEKALEYYRKVEAVQPDNLDIALQIGQVLVRMENYKEALSYFYKVEYLEKNPVNAQRAIAWCSFLTGKDEEALKYCHIILQNPSCAGQDWMNVGHVYFAMRNIREAVKNYLKAQEYEKNHTNFLNVFNKDKEALLSRGLSEEDIRIVLDLLV